MSVEWWPNGEGTWGVQLGVQWNEELTSTSLKISPEIFRWDQDSTNNYGSKFYETLYLPNGTTQSWTVSSYYLYEDAPTSGTITIDTFAVREYPRKESAYNIYLTLETDSQFGTFHSSGQYFETIGSQSHDFWITIPALDNPNKFYYYNDSGDRKDIPKSNLYYYDENGTRHSVTNIYYYDSSGNRKTVL